jgi:hypothetical protein
MNRSMKLAVALALGGTISAYAAERVKAPTPMTKKANTGTVVASVAAQISGKITWKGNVALKPGTGDSCAHFKVTVSQPVPGNASGGGIAVPSFKELASTTGKGTIGSGSCTYMVSGVPSGTDAVVSAGYDGAMGGAADTKMGSSSQFKIEDKKTYKEDVEVSFTQIK